MRVIDFLKGIFSKKKEIDLKILPSQGYFYDNDFKIYIKKANDKDIKDYEFGFVVDDLSVILRKVKRIVKKNIIIPEGYNFEYIKSIDVIFLFFEVVKFTKNKKIKIFYFDESGEDHVVDFESKNFNYFNFNNLKNNWNSTLKEFLVDGYKFTLPSLGVENSITQFLIDKSYEVGSEKYNEYNYNFVYFVGNKDFLTYDEIENLIQIFNYDLDDDEKDKVNNIIRAFSGLHRYTLRKGNEIIEITSRINLENIWK
jgi:hypothetical protein